MSVREGGEGNGGCERGREDNERKKEGNKDGGRGEGKKNNAYVSCMLPLSGQSQCWYGC